MFRKNYGGHVWHGPKGTWRRRIGDVLDRNYEKIVPFVVVGIVGVVVGMLLMAWMLRHFGLLNMGG